MPAFSAVSHETCRTWHNSHPMALVIMKLSELIDFQPPSFGPPFSSAEAATGGKATAQSCQFHIEPHILQMPVQFEDLEVTPQNSKTQEKQLRKTPKLGDISRSYQYPLRNYQGIKALAWYHGICSEGKGHHDAQHKSSLTSFQQKYGAALTLTGVAIWIVLLRICSLTRLIPWHSCSWYPALCKLGQGESMQCWKLPQLSLFQWRKAKGSRKS